MVYSLSIYKVFASEIRVDVTTTSTTTTTTTTCPYFPYTCKDADGDGYGDSDNWIGQHFCNGIPQYPDYVLDCTDCNDNDPNVHDDCCQCPEFSITGCIWGTVVYAPNQQPSPGMTVILRRVSPEPGVKMKATTDSNGCYRFDGLFSGKYIIGLKGCKSRSDRKERTIDIVDFVTINKNIGWRHNRRLTRCFYVIRD